LPYDRKLDRRVYHGAPGAHPCDARRRASGARRRPLRAPVAAGAAAVRGRVVAAGRVSRAWACARGLDSDAARAQGRRGRAVLARAARDGRRARPPPGRVAARDRIPGARPAWARSGASAGHRMASGRRAPARARLRPRPDRARRARAAPGEALVHQHRVRPRSRHVHDLGAVRDLHRERRGLLEATGERRTPGPGGGRPGAVYRFGARELAVTDPFAVLRPPTAAR
jgi:hypothetical protein